MIANEGVLARIYELKTSISEGVAGLEIRNRSAPYPGPAKPVRRDAQPGTGASATVRDHPEGATGMVMKDYRGQKAQKEIWKFDAALSTQVLHTLKQVAIEAGQWNEKRQSSGELGIDEITRRLNAGRDRCAAAKAGGGRE